MLIVGDRHFTDYSALRATLDALLAHRLPGVELLTIGGRGVPVLAVSYATARGLNVVPYVADYRRSPETPRSAGIRIRCTALTKAPSSAAFCSDDYNSEENRHTGG